MRLSKIKSTFLRYLIEQEIKAGERVPTLAELSQELGVSVGKLREELELARHLELVSVRPRKGIRRETYNFLPAVQTSLLFSLATDGASFEQFSVLRQAIETSLWDEAVQHLTSADKKELQAVLARAQAKLTGTPPHIPTTEHRDLHMMIFKRLDNPFVQGVLEAYWVAYDASEFTRYVSYDHWLRVWDYHSQIVAALCENELDVGRELLIAHFELLPQAAAAAIPSSFSENGDL